MKELAIILMVIALVLALIVVSIVMALLLRIQEHEQQIQDLRRDINNLQQGGQEITARMNHYERNLQGNNAQ